MENETPIIELGSTEDDEFFTVTRPFLLTVKEGPPVSVPVGGIVRLTNVTARMNFGVGRILPVGLKDPGLYEILHDFKTIDGDGKWLELRTGDVVELGLSEGVDLMKKFFVKPTKRRNVE